MCNWKDVWWCSLLLCYFALLKWEDVYVLLLVLCSFSVYQILAPNHMSGSLVLRDVLGYTDPVH